MKINFKIKFEYTRVYKLVSILFAIELMVGLINPFKTNGYNLYAQGSEDNFLVDESLVQSKFNDIESTVSDSKVELYYKYYRECLLDYSRINLKTRRSSQSNSTRCSKLEELSQSVKNNHNENLQIEENKLNYLYQKIHSILSDQLDQDQTEHFQMILAKVLNIKLLLKNDNKDFLELDSLLAKLHDSQDVYIKEESIFLRASFYDRNKNPKSWFYYKLLADRPYQTVYGVASSVLIGDYYFNQSKYHDAYLYYKKGLDNLDIISNHKGLGSFNSYREVLKTKQYNLSYLKIQDFNFKILYRISWAAFLDSNSFLAYDYVLRLIDSYQSSEQTPTSMVWSYRYEDVKKDIEEILVDILYEYGIRYQNLYYDSKPDMLKDKVFLSLIKKFYENSVYKECIRVGTSYSNPSSKYYLTELSILAKCYEKSSDITGSIQVHEKISSLYLGSYWNKKYENDQAFLDEVDSIGFDSSLKAGSFYYERKDESSKLALKSSFIYEGLIAKNKDHVDVITWYVKLLNLYYSLSYYQKVLDLSSDLYHRDLSSVQYDNIASVDIKARLKLIEKSKNASQDIDRINEIYSDINDSKSISYLRLTMFIASSFKELELYDSSILYYQKVLLVTQKPIDVSQAMRGILFDLSKLSDDSRTISVIHGFLNYHDIDKIDPKLKEELMVALSFGLDNESKRYYENAQFDQAEELLIDDLNKYGNGLKNKSLLCSRVLELSAINRNFDEDKLKVCKKHPLYLYYRGTYLENIMEFNKASESYLEFALNYPKDKLVELSLSKAEKLSVFENNYEIQAKTLELKAKLQKEKKDFKKYIDLSYMAAQLYLKAKNYSKAYELSKKVIDDNSVSRYEKYEFKILQAKVLFVQKKEDQAFSMLDQIVKDFEKKKNTLMENKCILDEARSLMIGDLKTQIASLPTSNTQNLIDQKYKLYLRADILFKKMKQESCQKIWKTTAGVMQLASKMVLDQIENTKDSALYNKNIDSVYKLKQDTNYLGSLQLDSLKNEEDGVEYLFDNL